MPNAQGPGLCSTSVDKKDDHVCSMLVHVVCCNLIRVFFYAVEWHLGAPLHSYDGGRGGGKFWKIGVRRSKNHVVLTFVRL